MIKNLAVELRKIVDDYYSSNKYIQNIIDEIISGCYESAKQGEYRYVYRNKKFKQENGWFLRCF